ncbi:MAG: hypothetical protein OEV49_05510 [candidate division Zixibacteria bacterium]|nr:hypothetical protein [candidate division Zixibacteria bacterium]MDH4032738.1 hypothetical protein [candidate division Zixibacteria bacterium]
MASFIANKGLKISLLSSAPGSLVDVADKLHDAILENTGSEPVALLQLFGRYDVGAIYYTDDFLSGPSKSGSIDNIRGGNQIFAFPWSHSRDEEFPRCNDDAGYVWGLLFFKTAEMLSGQYGAIIDQVLSDQTADSEKVQVDVLGTTGWAELLFVVRGHSFKDVTDALARLGRTKVSLPSSFDSEATDTLVVAKTFSMVGIDFSLVKNGDFDTIRKSFIEPIDMSSGVFPRWNVACIPGNMQQVYDSVTEKIGNGYCSYGGFDLSFDATNSRTWGEFIANVLELRRDLGKLLYSTSVHILGHDGARLFPTTQSTLVDRKAITVDSERMDLFNKWGPVFESILFNLYFGTNTLVQDPLIGSCFSDLRLVLDETLPRWLVELDPEDSKDRNFVGAIIELITYASVERAHGAFMALEYPQGFFTPTKGGIQRILKAVSSVVRTVLSRVGVEWNGFVVVGYYELGFSSYNEPVNLPSEYMFKPEGWWGLFHEAGHVAMMRTDFIDLLSNPATEDVIRVRSFDTSDPHVTGLTKNFIYEIGADAFDLYFCHRGDFDLYLTNIWRYIKQRTLQINHYIRYFLMYLYSSRILNSEDNRFSKSLSVRTELEGFKEKLNSLDLDCPDEARYDDAVLSDAATFLPIIEFLHESFLEKTAFNPAAEELEPPPIVEAIESVLSGQVYTKSTVAPDLFVIALNKRNGQLTLASRIAALLTLWHTETLSES